MQVRLQIVFGVVLLLFMIAVVHMIRKRYLEIKYTLSWFMTLVFLMIVDVFPGILSSFVVLEMLQSERLKDTRTSGMIAA